MHITEIVLYAIRPVAKGGSGGQAPAQNSRSQHFATCCNFYAFKVQRPHKFRKIIILAYKLGVLSFSAYLLNMSSVWIVLIIALLFGIQTSFIFFSNFFSSILLQPIKSITANYKLFKITHSYSSAIEADINWNHQV